MKLAREQVTEEPARPHSSQPTSRNSIEKLSAYSHYLIVLKLSLDIAVSILYTIPPNRKNTHLEVKGEIDDAISRLFKNPHEITYTTLLVALLYILRYRHGLENNRTSTSSEQRRLGRPLVLVVAIMLASKFISDQHVSNETWAAENRLNLLQINTAEIIFLKTVDHRLHIDPKSFQRWVSFIFQPHKVSPYMS